MSTIKNYTSTVSAITSQAMIKLEQAELLQVFLPYAYDMAKDQPLFDKVKESGFKLLNQ